MVISPTSWTLTPDDEQALRHGIVVRFVKDKRQLARHGGVVGILPKDETPERAQPLIARGDMGS